jgi:RimJ/RimL family protein N-acetyltransferase
VTGFDPQPTIEGETLTVRPLAAADRDGLHAAASDPRTWAGHPANDRWRRDVFDRHFDFLLDTCTTLAVADRASGRLIGCSRYYVPPDRPGSIAIGFTFLAPTHWGGSTNFELKRLMLGHAFAHFPEVWFHIDPSNRRSQVATTRLGAVHACDAELDLAGTPARWMCYRLDRDSWERTRRTRESEATAGNV